MCVGDGGGFGVGEFGGGREGATHEEEMIILWTNIVELPKYNQSFHADSRLIGIETRGKMCVDCEWALLCRFVVQIWSNECLCIIGYEPSESSFSRPRSVFLYLSSRLLSEFLFALCPFGASGGMLCVISTSCLFCLCLGRVVGHPYPPTSLDSSPSSFSISHFPLVCTRPSG